MDYNVCIAGAAGDGVRGGSVILGRVFSSLGYDVFVYQEYQSLIRGGHNAGVVRASEKRVHSHRFEYDAFICMRDYVFEIHKKRIKGFVLHDSAFECDHPDTYSVPMTDMVKERKLSPIFRNAVALGAMCYLSGISIEILKDVFKREYGKKAEPDLVLADDGYRYAEEQYDPVREIGKIGDRRPVMAGNDLIAGGLVQGGLECYYAYPMTPSSSILHLLARQKLAITVHPESEISAIMMAIGSAYAGKRSAVGTSGGGFALMAESVSLAGMAEVPVVIVEAQRSGPSTGMATYTAQQDLYFVLYPAHGEFPLIVASPLTVEDAFYLSGELLNLAWKFQTPAILLTDKHLSESYETVSIEPDRVHKEEPEIVAMSDGIFKRYEVTESGVSPMAVPPAIVKANSNEHDEYGITTDDAEIAERMYSKRMRKETGIRKTIEKLEPYRIEGDGDTTLITWGSTYGAVVEAGIESGFKVVGIRYLRPLILPELEGDVISIECNYSGLLANLIEKETGKEVKRILRWDGRPFTPDELKRKMEEIQ